MSTQSPGSQSKRVLMLGLGSSGLIGIAACLCLATAVIVALILVRARQSPAAGPVVAYILDASGRMNSPGNDTQTRLAVAQAVMAEVIRPSDPGSVSALRVFGTGAAADACLDTNLVVPFAPANQANIAATLPTLAIGPAIDAPLGEAIVETIREAFRL